MEPLGRAEGDEAEYLCPVAPTKCRIAHRLAVRHPAPPLVMVAGVGHNYTFLFRGLSYSIIYLLILTSLRRYILLTIIYLKKNHVNLNPLIGNNQCSISFFCQVESTLTNASLNAIVIKKPTNFLLFNILNQI